MQGEQTMTHAWHLMSGNRVTKQLAGSWDWLKNGLADGLARQHPCRDKWTLKGSEMGAVLSGAAAGRNERHAAAIALLLCSFL
jgi:hypothetical protein